mgnify:CR=1 FL=1
MSRTIKKIHKGKPKGRGNQLGLCGCPACKAGRLKRKSGETREVIKMKHKFRTEWKTNKKFKKGMYTD